jgi:uncharacterized membrane protein YhhN
VTTAAWVLLAVTGLFALGDWWAVGRQDRRLEYVCKPGTLLALTAVALALDPADGAVRAWFVVALVCSLAGDVFLMLPEDRFVPGLASFLLGHVAYVVGLVLAFDSGAGLAFGGLATLAAIALVGRPIVGAVRRDHPDLFVPVVAYMTVISAMVVSACGTASPWAIGGAALFYSSDAMLARDRFVGPFTGARVAIHVTYHLGQLGLVLSLL